MIKSMTGFGSREQDITAGGKISVEIRSANHKFLEIVFHLPEGFLALEDKMKRIIESKIKRGRLTCAINVSGASSSSVFINKPLLKNYLAALKEIRKESGVLAAEADINTLIQLPGVLSMKEERASGIALWPRLRVLIEGAVEDLVKTRKAEGAALGLLFKKAAEAVRAQIGSVKTAFKKAVKKRLAGIKTDEERAAFLKNSDITEELDRLAFHVRNFKKKLVQSGPVGKELDFIAQEMQREANTLGAKSFDAAISATVVQIKSQIEKIREQVQNIE